MTKPSPDVARVIRVGEWREIEIVVKLECFFVHKDRKVRVVVAG
jgi:hypothetical protein